MKNLPITKKNVLRFMPCSESRLFQVFVPKGLEAKKTDRYTERLLATIAALKRRHYITESVKFHSCEAKDGTVKETKMVGYAMNGQIHDD